MTDRPIRGLTPAPLLPPQTKLPGLAIILPAYNEQETIVEAVQAAFAVLPDVAEVGEVIVVNDGSADATPELVRALHGTEPDGVTLRLLTHTTNLGYGAAITHGFRAARTKYVFYTDSDLQFDVGELRTWTDTIVENDAVFGFRVYRYDPPLRLIVSWVYNRIVDVLFFTDIRDVDCAFKVFDRDAFVKLNTETTDFFIDTEMVARLRRWDLKFAQIGVNHYERAGGSSTVRPSDVPRTLRTVGHMWKRIHFPSRSADAVADVIRQRNLTVVVEELPTGALGTNPAGDH